MQHSAIWMAGVYLMLLMQFLENKVAVDLTRSEFVEAQEVGCVPLLMVLVLLPNLFTLLCYYFYFSFLSDMLLPFPLSLWLQSSFRCPIVGMVEFYSVT